MSTVILPVGGLPAAFNDFAGNADKFFSYIGATREYESEVPQVTLDAALVNYTANQAAIDAAYAQAVIDRGLDEERDKLDTEKILKALAELLVDEFNILRVIEGLPPRTFAQLRTAIRNKVV